MLQNKINSIEYDPSLYFLLKLSLQYVTLYTVNICNEIIAKKSFDKIIYSKIIKIYKQKVLFEIQK